MSKSLGNFTTLRELITATDPRAYRLLVLRAHYRSPVEVTRTSVADATAALQRLDAFARRAAALPAADPDPEVVARFRELMDDDLNTPAATALVFDAVRRANAALDADDVDAAAPLAAAVLDLTGAVGLVVEGGVGDDLPPEVAELVARRDAARAAKDWSTSDRLRDELVAQGWVVEDGPEGTSVRRR